VLQRAGVVPVIGELEPAGVAAYLVVSGKSNPNFDFQARDKLEERCSDDAAARPRSSAAGEEPR
jgi:hypothetical protein